MNKLVLDLKLYWLDTGWACGGVLVDQAGLVRETCPIFRRFLGQPVTRLQRAYKVIAVDHPQTP